MLLRFVWGLVRDGMTVEKKPWSLVQYYDWNILVMAFGHVHTVYTFKCVYETKRRSVYWAPLHSITNHLYTQTIEPALYSALNCIFFMLFEVIHFDVVCPEGSTWCSFNKTTFFLHWATRKVAGHFLSNFGESSLLIGQLKFL